MVNGEEDRRRRDRRKNDGEKKLRWSAVEFWESAGTIRETDEYGVVGGNQNGIQQLLGAEQEAQHIVNAARSAKQARLKQAKDEAEKEIAEFRAFMEAEFQRKLEQTSGDSGANVKRLDQETFAKIQHLKAESESISNDVVQMLLRQDLSETASAPPKVCVTLSSLDLTYGISL
ncbi:hypothetical protein MTR67_025065, partial [Solanum verrucosum]